MSARYRKLLGLFILLPGMFFYLLIAAALSERLPDFWLIKLVYFAIAGIAWAFPVKRLMGWMNAGH